MLRIDSRKALRQRGAVRVSPEAFVLSSRVVTGARLLLEEQQLWSSVSDGLNRTLERCLVGRCSEDRDWLEIKIWGSGL